MTRILHFTLGPVQGFVADARRTRDLWAGSFLLSWLSAQAMLAVERDGGKIIFPDTAADPILEALRSNGARGNSPFIGSVPNRFKAEVSATFDPKTCEQAVQAAWHRLAGAVWTKYVADTAGHGNRTAAIWQRQVANFWDMVWVIGDVDPAADGAASDGAWLDRRKNWRSHIPTHADPLNAASPRYQEGGDHCQLMGFLQELSGFVRAGGEAGKQNDFWTALQKATGVLNLRDRERLSAIALIKRMFPVIGDGLKPVIGWEPGASVFNVRNWPSVSYVAAAPWLRHAWALDAEACKNFAKSFDELTRNGIYGESETRLLGEAYRDPFFKLDGQCFHADAIRSMDISDFKGATDDERQLNHLAATRALETLQSALKKAHREKTAPPPHVQVREPSRDHHKYVAVAASEFYALLLGDGDQIGKNLRSPGGQDTAKKGLADFTLAVPSIVQRHMGATIYAGGDDVLAVLPLDEAIPAALALRDAYATAFDKNSAWTFSASIVFAQYQIPIRAVLSEAHRQLDAVAKEDNGRDSLALSVLKPGGCASSWVSTWHEGSGGNLLPGIVQAFAQDLQRTPALSSSFFYNVRQRYEPLFADGVLEDDGSLVQRLSALLSAEYGQGSAASHPIPQIEQLMRVGLPWRRVDGSPVRAGAFNFDTGLVMRFLAREGRWAMTAAAPETAT